MARLAAALAVAMLLSSVAFGAEQQKVPGRGL